MSESALARAVPAARPGGERWSVTGGDAWRVLEPGAGMWIWRRELHGPVRDGARALAEDVRFDVRGTIGADGDPAAVAELLDRVALPASPARRLICADVARLVLLFAGLLAGPRVRVRLAASEGGLCPLLHVDNVELRLLCTYAGPGTEWAPAHAVRRGELGMRGRTPEAANAAICPDPAQLRELGPGWVAIFRGGAGSEQTGVVHRSPARPGRRLYLVLDAPR